MNDPETTFDGYQRLESIYERHSPDKLPKNLKDPLSIVEDYLGIPEKERLAAQALFPAHKVFASRCSEPGDLSYTNTNQNRFMAVYAGMTSADANRMLTAVKATGKFPGANIRRMRAVMNGT